MRVYRIAMLVLIFSLVSSGLNELSVMSAQLPESGSGVNESSISGVFEISGDDQFASVEDYKEDSAEIGGISGIWKVWNILTSLLKNALLVGSLFKQYVPGQVGVVFGTMVTAMAWAIYAWALIQWKFKISSKGMD